MLGRTVQTIVPFTQDNKEVFVHTLIRIRGIGNQPNCGDLTPKVITLFLTFLTIINLVYVMASKVGPYFLV